MPKNCACKTFPPSASRTTWASGYFISAVFEN